MSKKKQEAFETFEFDLPPIRGFPELRWAGKRPFRSTQYYPAQKKEAYGDPTDGWWNRIYWGDNLQVMSHLLREFRGRVDLIYIDPPFDSGADYKKTVKVRGRRVANDTSTFEEKQYTDIWTNDEFLQFIFERLTLCRELLSEKGTIYLHCDQGKSHFFRMLMDEVFLPSNFLNSLVWDYRRWPTPAREFQKMHDDIIAYTRKKGQHTFNKQFMPRSEQTEKRWKGKAIVASHSEGGERVPSNYGDSDSAGSPLNSVWYFPIVPPSGNERTGYPTQKPEPLIRRLLEVSSDPGDLVFDCFMGSGTTQAVAMKLGRRFIGADINLGAIETTIKRLNGVRRDLEAGATDLFADDDEAKPSRFYTGFEVYNVNNYDLFRNPVEAKELIKEAMELQPLSTSSIFDGQHEEYLVKIMPVNRIATRADLNEVINGLDFKAFETRAAKAPNKPVERIHLVCMGHEPDLGPELVKAAKPFDIEVIVTDLIRDKAHLHFKRASDARLKIEDGHLVIACFYPMNLLQKLSMEADAVEDWRQLVESIKIDWNYDGAVLTPAIVDAPEGEELVAGRYPIPADASTIRVKITDLLSESWEGEVEHA